MDPDIHNTNTPAFRGRLLQAPECEGRIGEDLALAAVAGFIQKFGTRPTANSWRAAGMSPSEKTIRRRFGSFGAAIEAASAVT